LAAWARFVRPSNVLGYASMGSAHQRRSLVPRKQGWGGVRTSPWRCRISDARGATIASNSRRARRWKARLSCGQRADSARGPVCAGADDRGLVHAGVRGDESEALAPLDHGQVGLGRRTFGSCSERPSSPGPVAGMAGVEALRHECRAAWWLFPPLAPRGSRRTASAPRGQRAVQTQHAESVLLGQRARTGVRSRAADEYWAFFCSGT